MVSASPRPWRVFLIVVIVLLCIGLDQYTKQMATAHLSNSLSTVYLQGLVRLQYSENSGIFSSIGIDLPSEVKFWLFTVGAALAQLVLLSYLLLSPRTRPAFLVGGSLVVGGGLSNVFDRLLHDGVVIDFVYFDIGYWITNIFNLADLAISLGLLLMLLTLLHGGKRKATHS